MNAFILLLACLTLGVLTTRYLRPPLRFGAAVNFWILYVALPALVLVQIPRLSFDASLLFPALAPWIVLIGAALLLPFLGRRLGWSRGTVGALVLSCGLGNTAFMGLPMIQALRGPEALGAAIIADQLGSFLALSSAGVLLAAHYAGRAARPAELLRRVVLFPSFLALIAGGLVRLVGGWPEWLAFALAQLGATLTPLALFSVGLQFRLGDVRTQWRPLAVGLSWKLLLAPLLVFTLAAATGASGLPVTVAVLQCAMAPMITAGILAQQHGLNPPLASAVVSVGVLLSLLTVPLWSWALG